MEGDRSWGIEHPGLEEDTVQEARVLISRRLGGIGAVWVSVCVGEAGVEC